jgi:hypothetical protein
MTAQGDCVMRKYYVDWLLGIPAVALLAFLLFFV